MNRYNWSIWEALRYGIKQLLDNFWLFFKAGLTYLLLAGLALTLWLAPLGILANIIDRPDAHFSWKIFLTWSPLFLALFIVFVFLLRFLSLGYTKIALDSHDNKNPTVETLFSCFHLVLSDVVATFLYVCMCFIGLLFFIIPGIYLAIRYSLFHIIIVDQQCSPIEALKKSAHLTEGSMTKLFGVMFIGRFLQALVPIFNFFIQLPWLSLTEAHIYRTLQELHSSSEFKQTHTHEN